MIFKQFEDKQLSQFSYLIASDDTPEAIVIDPSINSEIYIQYALEHNLNIKYVTETHIHADYLSGIRRLARHANAEILISNYDSGEKYDVAFNHKPLNEGDEIKIGDLTLEVIHTPGHTPEHISFSLKQNNEVSALITGDFLFIGSVGRPDLLGEDAKIQLANHQFDSVTNKLKPYKDEVLIFPGHGAGSLCGSGMSKSASSTLGEERKHNPYLDSSLTREQFVQKLTSNSPHRPDYYLTMKEVNYAENELISDFEAIPELSLVDFSRESFNGIVVDFREPLSFGGGHIPNSFNIAIYDKLSFWAAYTVPYDMDIFIVESPKVSALEAQKAFATVGIHNIQGSLKGGINAFVESGEDFEDIAQVSVQFLEDMLDAGENIILIDVRSESEYKEAHIKQARHFYLGTLKEQMHKISKDEDAEVYVICGGGFRSSLACSILKAGGYSYVYNVMGGMNAWKKLGFETV
jgi:hydroxyacylglutathione hydrolase